MADKHKKITVGNAENPWQGIDRSTASKGVEIFKDMEIVPSQNPPNKAIRRPEYDALYDDRPAQFEHTTDDIVIDQAPGAQEVIDITEGHTIYRSHRRKLVAVGHSGSTEYRFTIYVEISASEGHVLRMERGVRDGVDIDWEPASVETLDIFALAAYDASDWIEASMRMNGDEDTIYIAVSYHDDSEPETLVDVYEITTLYEGDFKNGTTVSAARNLADDTSITRDLDIEYDDILDLYIVAYGWDDGGDIKVRLKGSVGGSTTIFTVTGKDIYSISLVIKRTITSGAQYYLTYTQDEGDPHKLYRKYVYFDADSSAPTPSGGATLIASDVYDNAGDSYLNGACSAMDDNDTVHWLYKNAAGTLIHAYLTVAAGATVQTTTATTDLLTTATLTDSCWDFVVKDDLITVFYLSDTTTDAIYKVVRIIDSGDEDYNSGAFYSAEMVRADPDDYTYIRGFGTYRNYEINTSKCLSFAVGSAANANNSIRYLHEDKGLFDANFDGDVTDAADKQVQIEVLKEPLVADADGAMSQILFLQCDDDYIYKRGNYQWDLLEGIRGVDNTSDAWSTVFTPRAHIWDMNGVVRFGAGNGATNQNAWYGWIDRYFFEDATSDDRGLALRYQDHYSNKTRPDLPAAAIVTTYEGVNQNHADWELATLQYSPFLTGAPLFQQSRVECPYDPDKPYLTFFSAISFEYDGYQESQLRKHGASHISGRLPYGEALGLLYALQKYIITLNTWNLNTSPLNARITALNIYWGQKMSERDTADTVVYKKVKRIVISDEEDSNWGTTVADDKKGWKKWTDNGDGTHTLTTYVDYDHWMSGEDVGGTAADNLGNNLVIYDSTAASGEIYTANTFIPEGYKYAVEVNKEVWMANMRIAGQTRTNRLMKSARRLGSIVTPDHCAGVDFVVDLPYDIQGLSFIGDKILVVAGTHGFQSFDVSSGYARKLESVTNVGTDAYATVYPIVEGGLGNIIRGVLFKDPEGHIRIFDGYGAAIISDPINRDFDNSNRGIDYLNTTSAQFIYLPLYRRLMLCYDTQIFVFDYDGSNWYDWRFTKGVDAAAVGVDGEMFFTDGEEVWVFPQTGTIDNPAPEYRGNDLPVPVGTRVLLKKIWMDYILTTDDSSILQPAAYKDRAASPTNTTGTLAASASQVRNETGFPFGSNIQREVALEFHTTDTDNLTALEVDQMVAEIQPEKRRPR
jgi:hypothetical protein